MGVSAGDRAQNNPGIAEYTDIYPSLAAQFDVPLYEDMLGGVRDNFNLMQLDGLHPTRAGVKIMAARMVTFLVPHLPKDIQNP
jgi:lysophospholipase L1-like esterase